MIELILGYLVYKAFTRPTVIVIHKTCEQYGNIPVKPRRLSKGELKRAYNMITKSNKPLLFGSY